MQTKTKLAIGALVVAGSAVLGAAPAAAQATRTFVSAVGDDANPCSRTAPCRTFAGTISKTATGGEINCIDPGSFGTVTIAKSITIDCTGMIAGQTASTTTGITINPPADSFVRLRGLSITGAPTALPGNVGIRIIAPVTLLLEGVQFQGFTAASPFGIGIYVTHTTGNVQLMVRDSSFSNMSLAGIKVEPAGAATAEVGVYNSSFFNAGADAVRFSTTGGGTTLTGRIVNSSISAGLPAANGLSIKAPTGTVRVLVKDSTITNALGNGISVNGTNSIVRVSGSAITNNARGLLGSQIISYGNNVLAENTVDGSFTSTVPLN